MRSDVVERRAVTPAVAGVLIVALGVAAAASAAVPGRLDRLDGTVQYGWAYSPEVWLLCAALVVAGAVMLLRPGRLRPAAAVAAVVAAQVAGNGIVATRDWFNINGATSMAQNNLATVVAFAAAVAVCAGLAGCVSLAVLWREPAQGWAGLRPTQPTWLATGIVVAVLLPPILMAAIAWPDRDITTLGQFALTYSLPWGAGLAATGWLRGSSARAARITVAASAVAVAASITLQVLANHLAYG